MVGACSRRLCAQMLMLFSGSLRCPDREAAPGQRRLTAPNERVPPTVGGGAQSRVVGATPESPAGQMQLLLALVLMTTGPVGGDGTPASALSLAAEQTPVLVAQAGTLLYYPLLQHVFGNHSSDPAILLRAQTSPDVDVPCADATFVSFDSGATWQPSAPEVGTSKYGPHVQKRVCYPYPLSSSITPGEDSAGDSALCLPYARDAAVNSPGAALTSEFLATLWRRNATTNVLQPVDGTVDKIAVRFSDPFMRLGSRRYTDGNALPTLNGSGWLLTLYATAGIHKQEMPLSIHVYHSTDLVNWAFRARLGTAYLASENAMVRLKDSRLMMVFRSELPQRKLFQTFSSDEGVSWTEPSTMSGVGPGGDPHSCEPKLVRIGNASALVLSSGRPGQFMWFADEESRSAGGGHVPIEAAVWQSFDIQAHHDAAFGSSHPDWCFSRGGQQTGGYTGYSSLSLLPNNRLVVAYDRMPAGQPHGAPPTRSQGSDRIFALSFEVKRQSPSPAPSPHWQPNRTCQAAADRWCMQHCLQKIAGHTPDCGSGPMVARCAGASDAPPTTSSQWRCYGVSTLDSNQTRYVNGSCYCSMSAEIRQVFAECGDPPPPGACSTTQPPAPEPPAHRSWSVPFTKGQNGYQCFRIPALVTIPTSGRWLLFAEGRTNCLDGPFGDQIDIVMKASTDSGHTWGGMQRVYGDDTRVDGKPVWIGNPSPVLLSSGQVLLVCVRNNRRVLVLRSSTAGQTWSDPVDVSATAVGTGWEFVATGPSATIQAASGRIVVCCDHSTSSNATLRHVRGAATAMRSHAMFSDTGGQTWNISSTVLADGDECAIAHAPNGSLLMAMRQATGSASLKSRQFSVSSTDGTTWTLPTTRPWTYAGGSNDCQASLVRLPGSERLILSAPRDTSGRSNMTLHVSTDSGASWRATVNVDGGPSGYSTLAPIDERTVALAWESAGSIRVMSSLVT